MLFHIITSILYQLIGPPMYELEPILSELEKPVPSQFSSFNYYLRLQFAITILSWATLWAVKLALLSFFWRLFDSVRTHARIFWWAMCGITVLTFVISVFLFGFNCFPLGSFFRFGEYHVPTENREIRVDTSSTGGCSTPGNIDRARRAFHFSSITDIVTDFLSMFTNIQIFPRVPADRSFSHDHSVPTSMEIANKQASERSPNFYLFNANLRHYLWYSSPSADQSACWDSRSDKTGSVLNRAGLLQ